MVITVNRIVALFIVFGTTHDPLVRISNILSWGHSLIVWTVASVFAAPLVVGIWCVND